MGFVLPNEDQVTWSLMIVVYPFISGIGAGSFLVATLYHLLDRRSLRPVAPFALVAAFAFLLFAPLPLLLHLRAPMRALNMMVTPNFESVMAGFGFIYFAYLILVVGTMWFVFRGQLIARARGRGPVAWFCWLVLFGNLHESPQTQAADRRLARVLSGVALPLTILLPGYVGFLFGSIKANPWWSTSIMFAVFVASAFVSGFALVGFHYLVVCWLRRRRADGPAVRSLGRYLWLFLGIALLLELLEPLSIVYERTEEGKLLLALMRHKLSVSYLVLQIGVFSIIPFVLLGYLTLRGTRRRATLAIVGVASGMLLGQVFLMRWNVVIGGQLLSKSMRGFTDFTPQWLDREGILPAMLILAAPFAVLWLAGRIVSMFPGASDARPGPAATDPRGD